MPASACVPSERAILWYLTWQFNTTASSIFFPLMVYDELRRISCTIMLPRRARPLDLKALCPVELVAACLASKEESAWSEFVRRFRPLISTVVLRTARSWGTPSAAQLDDLIQETFLKLCADECRLLRNFRPQHPGAIFGFLKVVTANVVHDHFKAIHAAKRGSGALSAATTDFEGNDPSGFPAPSRVDGPEIERALLLQEIDRCLLQGVSPNEVQRSRRIFWLYYRCGLSARAIAALPNIGLTTKGVESTILRLNRLVRTELGRQNSAVRTILDSEKKGFAAPDRYRERRNGGKTA